MLSHPRTTRRRRTPRPRVGALIVALALSVPVTLAVMAGPGASATAQASGQSKPPAEYQKTIDAAVSAAQRYWADTFPDLYDGDYTPIPRARIFAGRPGVKLPTCQGQKLKYADVNGNAFYCYRDNYVAYDDVELMPSLYETYGAYSLAIVLAHEWGHAIQDRAGTVEQPTIYKELQADCFAGAFTEHISGRSSALEVSGADLEASIAALLTLRDAPGTSPDDPSAHGSAFDRVGAFQDGMENGAERCAEYFDAPPVLVELPFTDQTDFDSGGNVAAEEVLPLTVQLLNEFYGLVEPAYVAKTAEDDVYTFDSSDRSTTPECGGSTLARKDIRNRVFYCLDDGYFAFDEPFLQAIYDEIGDFGAGSLLASSWATYVQTLQGIPGVDTNEIQVVFQADCYTGGWAAAFFNGYLSGGSLSPGDLDELVEALLTYSRARGVGADVPITFLRIKFFRQGFVQGYNSCGIDGITQQVQALGVD